MQSSSDSDSGLVPVASRPMLGGTRARARQAFALEGRSGWVVALAIGVAYVIFFLSLRSFPLQDYPNHVARGVVMADLLFQHGARFGDEFSLQLMAVPYILGDLVLATLVHFLGTSAGAGVFTGLVLLSLPGALLFYARMNGLAPRGRLLLMLLSLYLATDWFFLMGFMAFRLSIAAILVTLALAGLLRRRWSLGLFAVYTGALVLSYLIHLSWLAFFAVALGVSGAVRWWLRAGTTVGREIWLFAPVLGLLAWQHFAVPPQGGGNGAVYDVTLGGVALKLAGLRTEFAGFGGHLAEALIAVFVVCLAWPVRHHLKRQEWMKPDVLEPLAIAAAFLLVYVALPRNLQHTAYVDLRALPLMVLFAVIAVLRVSPVTITTLVLATILAVGNLAYLMRHVGQNDAWLSQYREVVRLIPRGVPVLSVYAGRVADSRPFLHAGSFVVIDRGGVTPYLFSGDRGEPMLYFRSRRPRYRPLEDWYGERQMGSAAARPDWRRIACDYDFLLLTAPFGPHEIGLPTRMVAVNPSAALLEVNADKENCPR